MRTDKLNAEQILGSAAKDALAAEPDVSPAPAHNQVFKPRLTDQELLHAEKTGVNISGRRVWLHIAANAQLAHYGVYTKSSRTASNAIDILPYFADVLCYEHWKPYYHCAGYQHALCDSYHLRELQRTAERDGQLWAQTMPNLLQGLHKATEAAGGALAADGAQFWRQSYRQVIAGGKVESPAPFPLASGQSLKFKCRTKRSKSHNLLERLCDYGTGVLRFMEQAMMPFTNKPGERDIQMTKAQQEVSSRFCLWDGANVFWRIRSYLLSCRKSGLSASDTPAMLYQGRRPVFMHDENAMCVMR